MEDLCWVPSWGPTYRKQCSGLQVWMSKHPPGNSKMLFFSSSNYFTSQYLVILLVEIASSSVP